MSFPVAEKINEGTYMADFPTVEAALNSVNKSESDNGTRFLDEINLFEVSVVTFQAAPAARVLAVKNGAAITGKCDEARAQPIVSGIRSMVREFTK